RKNHLTWDIIVGIVGRLAVMGGAYPAGFALTTITSRWFATALWAGRGLSTPNDAPGSVNDGAGGEHRRGQQ
ncbi:hypothetical protein PJM29_31880, partial [Mycobacterium kansasii]